MEVHHHPDLHHRKKHWREYFIEFIMIFLAVTLGFFAESYRESRTDRAKEIEYIKAMIEDAQTDTANFQQAIDLNQIRLKNLDSLAMSCFAYEPNTKNDYDIHRVFRRCIRHPDFVNPVERTLVQLKNSGGMRLLQRKIAADSIIQYDDFTKKLANQQSYYERYLNNLVDQSMELINYKYFSKDKATGILSLNPDESAKLINADKSRLNEFGNRASIYSAVVRFYVARLEEGKQHAVALIMTLKWEYKLN